MALFRGGKKNSNSNKKKETSKDKGLRNADDWQSIQEGMTDAMVRFEKALTEPLRQLK